MAPTMKVLLILVLALLFQNTKPVKPSSSKQTEKRILRQRESKKRAKAALPARPVGTEIYDSPLPPSIEVEIGPPENQNPRPHRPPKDDPKRRPLILKA